MGPRQADLIQQNDILPPRALLIGQRLFLQPLFFYHFSFFLFPHFCCFRPLSPPPAVPWSQSASLLLPIQTPPASIDSPNSNSALVNLVQMDSPPPQCGPLLAPADFFFSSGNGKCDFPVEPATGLISNEPASTPARSLLSWSLLLPPLPSLITVAYKPLEIAVLGFQPRPFLWSSRLLSTSPYSVDSPR